MAVPLLRTLILYCAVICAVRLMGKRQIGELDPSELVVTILVSDLAAVPMQDLGIPLLSGLVPIATLVVLEIFLSFAALKSRRFRRLLNGQPAIIIRRGQLDIGKLRQMRLTTDEVIETLRKQNVAAVSDVKYGVIEPDGTLTVILKQPQQPVTAEMLGITPKDTGLPLVVVSDGKMVPRSLELLRLRVDPMHERYSALLERASDWAARLRDQASLEEADSASLKKTIEDAKAEVARAKERVDTASAAQNEFKVARGKLEVQVEAAIKAITADGTTVLEEALMLPVPTDRDAAERELNQLVRQINNLGPVNQVAMEEYEQLKRRADYIEEQLADLESARKALTKITVAIDRKMRKAFLVTFEKVDANFREIFAMLFPGGQAHLEMTDPEHPAETGIEVVAQPRGKRITKMMLMSGGEKSLTALALLFAVYRTRTVPFYVLDEVEAALDDANLSKLIGALDVLRSDTQLLVISHQRRTMEDADVLYGVSMQADGVSRVVSQKLDRETGKVVNA